MFAPKNAVTSRCLRSQEKNRDEIIAALVQSIKHNMKDTSTKDEVKGGGGDVPPPPPVDVPATFPKDKKNEHKRFLSKSESLHSFFARERFKIKDKKVLPFYW